ncbi:MAG: hypothetical protein IIU00_06425, partial [Clostridia bacterium]|nr:hypothetical protein [Clostridia bacterium]
GRQAAGDRIHARYDGRQTEQARVSKVSPDGEGVSEMVCIGRPVDGISLNGLEYVYHDDGDGAGFGVLARFEDEAHAHDFLYQHGFSDDDIENQGIMFVDESEVNK